MDAQRKVARGQRPERGTRLSVVAAVAAALLASSGCGGDDRRGPVAKMAGLVQDTLRGKPVLSVETSAYFNADVKGYLKATGAEARGLPAAALSRLFDRFVDEMILLEAARQRGIALTDEEKTEALARYAIVTGARDAAEAEAEAEDAPPGSAFDRVLVEKYTALVVRDVRVEAPEVLDYYERHKKDFLHRGRIQVSQILVDTEQKAVSVLRRIDRFGETEFRQIATAESIGPEAGRGGVMGVFEQGVLPADMERVIYALDEGRTSRVVESSYGYHIFRLDRKFPPALLSADEAAPEIRERLTAQKMKEALTAHLAGLKDTLSWTSRPENLFFRYQRSDE
jgi:parvulin-like peptidyl-prolyl isomerase